MKTLALFSFAALVAPARAAEPPRPPEASVTGRSGHMSFSYDLAQSLFDGPSASAPTPFWTTHGASWTWGLWHLVAYVERGRDGLYSPDGERLNGGLTFERQCNPFEGACRYVARLVNVEGIAGPVEFGGRSMTFVFRKGDFTEDFECRSLGKRRLLCRVRDRWAGTLGGAQYGFMGFVGDLPDEPCAGPACAPAEGKR